MEDYRTVAGQAQSEHVVQRSRFIGLIFPVGSETEAASILDTQRKKYWDAKHCCYAFRIGEFNPVERSNDDGEPSGTAGKPILEILQRRGLTNVLLVVIRYFGGILLGTGGLTRAYGKAAQDAADAADVLTYRYCEKFAVDAPYPLWNRLEQYLRMNTSVLSLEYGEKVRCVYAVPESSSAAVSKALVEKTDGKLLPEPAGKEYMPCEV